MKRMLFNATQEEELRVAIVDGQKLIDLDIEHAGKEQRKSNIYKGVITRVEPSLEAAFVDYGMERHGFLPFKEISRQYFSDKADAGRARIQDVIKEGQEMIVQVDKDERGSKGAALTTFISLAGRYLVLMPNNPRGGGVSRRVEGEERNELRDTMAELEVPKNMSMIARTAGIGRTAEELQWDLNYLVQLWTAIEDASNIQKGAFLIYQEGSLVIRAIRDYFSADIGEILIDTPDVHEQAVQFMNHVMPGNVARVKLYQDEIPLFSRFQIEHQIETAFAREVRLPSGGAIVIDHTEALVSVDVNSGRSIKGADIEQTAYNTNLEAAEEVARQLRLRDLGGLVVIDFIDMESQKNQRSVEDTLRDALHADRARVQTGKISRFGLLELSRQRLRPSLGETNHSACPRCSGTGHIRGVESTALHILRITQEEAMKDNSAIIQVQLPVEAATFLLNEKRADIHKIEQRMGVEVILIPNIHMETPNYSIVRIKSDDVNEDTAKPSYHMVEVPPETAYERGLHEESKPRAPEAVVRGVTPATAAPIVEEKPATPVAPVKTSFLGKIKKWLAGDSGEVKAEAKAESSSAAQQATRDQNRENNRDRGGRNRNRNRNRDRNERDRADRDKGERNDRPQQQARNEQQQNRAEQKADVPAIAQNTSNQGNAQNNATQSNPEGAPQRERTGRRRGGRNRNRNRDRDPNRAPNAENAAMANEVANQAPAPTQADEAPVAAKPVENKPVQNKPVEAKQESAKQEVAAAAPVETNVAEASEKPAAKAKRGEKPAKAETAQTDAPQTDAAEAKTDAKPAAKPKKAPAKKPKAAKPVDLADSGLQLVETKAEAKPAKVKAEPAKPKAPRKAPNWKKAEDATKADEPLVIVQTQK